VTGKRDMFANRGRIKEVTGMLQIMEGEKCYPGVTNYSSLQKQRIIKDETRGDTWSGLGGRSCLLSLAAKSETSF